MITPTIARLRATLDAGEVSRYHAVPTVRPQSDALHCWNMLVLAMYITLGEVSCALSREIAFHDTGEIITGDMPYTLKRDNKHLAKQLHYLEDQARTDHTIAKPCDLSDRETAILKICDTLEGFVWCAKYENVSRISDSNLTIDRWDFAYQKCLDKFREDLTDDEWSRANEIYNCYRRVQL